MTFELRRITAQQTRPLRQQLLRQGIPLEKLVYAGDSDENALHVGAYDAAGAQVGIATVMRQPPGTSVGTPSTHPLPGAAQAWRLRGMAVIETMRGAGIGRAMLRACVGHVAVQGGAFLWCDAREHAVPFYEKDGFVVMGERYDVPGVGSHAFMQRPISPEDAAWLAAYLPS